MSLGKSGVLDGGLPALSFPQVAQLGPREAAHHLVHALSRLLSASYVALYDLDLSSGSFRSWVDTSSTSDASSVREHREFRVKKQLSQRDEDSSSDPYLLAVNSRAPVRISTPPVAESAAIFTHLYPITRGSTAIAVLRIDWQNAPSDIAVLQSHLDLYGLLIDSILERRFVLRLFDTLPQPTDINTSESEYLDQVAVLGLASAHMQFLALREANDAHTELTTIALWGFPTERPRETFDLRRSDAKATAFFAALDQDLPMAIPSVAQSDCPEVRAMAPEVESFVVTPVRVAGTLFGTLSLATSTEYEYSEVERLAFETIANAIGTAISNYRNFHTAAENIADLRELSKAVTAVELAQAARHEARVLLDTCQTELSNVRTFIAKNKVADAQAAVDRASDGFAEIESALDKIREAQMAPVRNASLEEQASIRELFLAARSYALGKLNVERISCEYLGPDLQARVSKAWLRNVFANFILNSIDAYTTGGSPKRRRWITLRAEPPEPRSKVFRLIYQDEAGGINPSALSRPRTRHETMPITQLVFERDVTSKPNGTGYGLFIARRVIQDLGGSVELTQYRRGVTLELTLPIERLVT